MRCKSDVCDIGKYGGAKEALHHVRGILHGPSAAFTRVSGFQEVDHRGCLSLLEEGDDVEHVEEVLEVGVIYPPSSACFANALALPRRAQQVHGPKVCHQVGQECIAVARDVLREGGVESSES